jgi:serine/threonine protein phosphatase PrpC
MSVQLFQFDKLKKEVTIGITGQNFCAYGRQGRRPTMEDEKMIVEKGGWKLYGVFDGHGGSKISLVLKETLPNHLLKYLDATLKKNPHATRHDIAETIKKGFIDLDKQLFDHFGALGDHVGSTAVVLIHNIKSKTVFLVNLGDSRAIVISQTGKLLLETKDHKPENPKESARIRKAGGFVKRNRVNGRLALSRAFGDFYFKRDKSGRYTGSRSSVSPKPTIVSYSMKKNHHYHIILACDGLWDVLTPQQVTKQFMATRQTQLVHQKSNSMNPGQQTCHKLVDTAYDRRSGDNISVLAVTI